MSCKISWEILIFLFVHIMDGLLDKYYCGLVQKPEFKFLLYL